MGYKLRSSDRRLGLIQTLQGHTSEGKRRYEVFHECLLNR